MDIAVIPARGGSKRIPRKNIKDFCGKPIIGYSIETALKSGLFDEVIVSTDDSEIATIAEQYGAKVPFIRPAEISDDYASTLDVVRHLMGFYRKANCKVNHVCCLYATAPFTTVDDLIKAKELLKGDVKYVFSATEFSYPIFRSFKVNSEKRVEMFWPEHQEKRSQDLETAYHDAGMFYFGSAQSFENMENIFEQHSKAYLLPHYRVQDIDTMDDWYRAERCYQLMENSL